MADLFVVTVATDAVPMGRAEEAMEAVTAALAARGIDFATSILPLGVPMVGDGVLSGQAAAYRQLAEEWRLAAECASAGRVEGNADG